MSDRKYLGILKHYWGYDSFRGVQRDIIESVAQGHDTLGLMPTGGGKSITFQVPTLAQDGLCLVITPLIALMKDQVAGLRAKGIKAAAIYSGMTNEQVIVALENCIYGNYKFLYVAPERLSSSIFITKISRVRVSLITVDEAHCISQWGYDFRPAYLQIGTLRALFPGVPVLALTASATPDVAADIQRQLHFAQPNVKRMSFDRKNLVYVVRCVESVEDEMLHILSSTTGSSIVYCRSRQQVQDIAVLLNKQGISSTFYHAGLAHNLRNDRQRQWTEGSVRVMVATNAFGMGIDKADVRLVIHVGPPDSLESYYQEAGRAGRDGERAYAVLIHTKSHITTLRKRIDQNFPSREKIAQFYEDMCCFLQMAIHDGQDVNREFDIEHFCVAFHYFPLTVLSCLDLLQQAGYIVFEKDPESNSRLCFLVRREELYKLNNLGAKNESIILTILRYYGGVFSDYRFISEQYIAEQSGATQHEVYQLLVTLARQRVVSYIPHKQMPIVIFKHRRVDINRLYIPKEIYDDRRNAFASRIEAMISYMQSGACRGNAILHYFGEECKNGCGHCDVCTAKRTRASERDMAPAARQAILDLFTQGVSSIDVDAVRQLHYPLPAIEQALQMLVYDDVLHLQGLRIVKS